jgi:hypothetical protein
VVATFLHLRPLHSSPMNVTSTQGFRFWRLTGMWWRNKQSAQGLGADNEVRVVRFAIEREAVGKKYWRTGNW